MELTRKQVIEELERFRLDSVYMSNKEKMIDKYLAYAISCLKADEIFQIMYESGEIFTKDDIVAMLTEIQVEIGENIKLYNHQEGYETEWSEGADWCIDHIQARIDTLRGKGNKTDKKVSN